MRYLVYGALSILLVIFILMIIELGVDKSVAQRDYEKACFFVRTFLPK